MKRSLMVSQGMGIFLGPKRGVLVICDHPHSPQEMIARLGESYPDEDGMNSMTKDQWFGLLVIVGAAVMIVAGVVFLGR